MLHATETWAMTVATLNRIRHNDRTMIRWICNVKANDEVSSVRQAKFCLRVSQVVFLGVLPFSPTY